MKFIDSWRRRCEERSTRPTPRGGILKNPKTPRSAKVSPETEPLQPLNENADSAVASPKQSRCLAHKTEDHWCTGEFGHIFLISSLEGVNREEDGKFTFEPNICSCDFCNDLGKGANPAQEDTIKPPHECGADDEAGVAFSCASCIKNLRAAICEARLTRPLRWLFKKRRNGNGSAKRKAKLESLPFDIRENIFRRLPLKELFRSKVLSKSCEKLAESDAFLRMRGESAEGSFTAINFFMKEKKWQCIAFDMHSMMWTRLPTLSFLPTPDEDLFKEYSVCGDDGLMCANVSKVPHKEELIVFNLITGVTRQLPSLHFPRSPVLVNILVDSATNSYKVIAAGSSSSSGEADLSRKVEVFDSQTMQWKVARDLPGPEFGLNEHQSGVCVDGVLYFIAFLEANGSKGVVAFDVEKGEWLAERSCCVPFSLHSNMLHLVKSGGNVYLFSEQEHGGAVEHCIDVLDFYINGSSGEAACELKNVVKVKKSGGRGLLVYPEYTCIPYGKGKLCVFNTIKRDGVVYDIQTGMQCEVLEEPPVNHRGDNFFSLNPVSFTLQPNFISKP
ncbi:hypothetical protein M758_2G031300 [Ceratodon purpureus]|nr:hypothetical protein M758_2G031300 [Ceratodon purpureus]